MKKFKTVILWLLFGIAFFALSMLPQYLPIDQENRNRATNILILFGAPIIAEWNKRRLTGRNLWASLKSTRDKIVVAASYFIMVIAGAVFEFPIGETKDSGDSSIAILLTVILCLAILLIGGSDTLKTMLTGHNFVDNNVDEDKEFN